MAVKSEDKACCLPGSMSSCRVESIVSVDERERAKIRPGDKLAVVSMEKDGKICCLSLIRVKELEGMVKSVLGPVIDDIFKK
jgi:hypothetical protein